MSTPKTDEAAIRAIIRALRGAGWELEYVDDGEDDVKVSTEPEAIEAVMAVDQAHLIIKRTDPKRGAPWVERGRVFFVLGNDPEEVACDYTVNLSDVIDPLTDTWWD